MARMDEQTFEDEVNHRLNRAMNRIHENTAAMAAADPNRFAATLVMEPGKPANTMVYPKVWRSKNISVQWGYTTNRNAAGRFLVFRETIKHKAVKGRKVEVSGVRDQWRPFLSKSSAIEQAKRAYHADRDAAGGDKAT